MANGESITPMVERTVDVEIEDDLDDKWKALHHIPRCIDDDGDVMFLHLARGIAKTSGTYSKPNRLGVKDWVKFYNNEVSN